MRNYIKKGTYKKRSTVNPPNLWDTIQVRRGKLVGMLTDDLARAVFSMSDSPTGAMKGGLSVVSMKEFGRKMPVKSN